PPRKPPPETPREIPPPECDMPPPPCAPPPPPCPPRCPKATVAAAQLNTRTKTRRIIQLHLESSACCAWRQVWRSHYTDMQVRTILFSLVTLSPIVLAQPASPLSEQSRG